MGEFFVQPDGALPGRLPLVIAAGGCELKTRGKKYQLFTPKVVRDPYAAAIPVHWAARAHNRWCRRVHGAFDLIPRIGTLTPIRCILKIAC